VAGVFVSVGDKKARDDHRVIITSDVTRPSARVSDTDTVSDSAEAVPLRRQFLGARRLLRPSRSPAALQVKPTGPGATRCHPYRRSTYTRGASSPSATCLSGLNLREAFTFWPHPSLRRTQLAAAGPPRMRRTAPTCCCVCLSPSAVRVHSAHQ
jgi:hypothetical protein